MPQSSSLGSTDITDEAQVSPTPRRILVVDSDHESAESLAVMLEMSGHAVEVAYDGDGAIASAAGFRPDVVLLDIGMPGLDGVETGRRLRGESWGKSMTLVALTDPERSSDRERAREAGFDECWVKPLDLSAMGRLMTGSISLRGTR